MIPSCPAHDDLMRWAQRGAGAPLGDELERHVDGCDACARERAAIEGVRRRLEDLPVRSVAPERLDAIRFALGAAARGASRTAEPRRTSAPPASALRPRLGQRMVAILVAAAALVGLVAVLTLGRSGLGGSNGATGAVAAASVAEIELAAGARGVHASPAPDEVYALLSGSARFHVRKLGPGQRFRVVAGGDSVEVRGTRFSVDVDDGRLSAVDVTEGLVLVTLADGTTHLLAAGSAWHRPAVVTALSAATAREVPTAPSTDATAEPADRAGEPSARADAPVATATVSISAAAAAPRVARAGAAAERAPSTSASAEPVASNAAADTAAFDAEFRRALGLLETGRAADAAAAFDALRSKPGGDAGRRGDVSYWSAQAHARAGHSAEAEERARAVLEGQGGSWHADDAALLLGESLLRRGDAAGARPWLERAARSSRTAVRARATQALERAGAGSSP